MFIVIYILNLVFSLPKKNLKLQLSHKNYFPKMEVPLSTQKRTLNSSFTLIRLWIDSSKKIWKMRQNKIIFFCVCIKNLNFLSKQPIWRFLDKEIPIVMHRVLENLFSKFPLDLLVCLVIIYESNLHKFIYINLCNVCNHENGNYAPFNDFFLLYVWRFFYGSSERLKEVQLRSFDG